MGCVGKICWKRQINAKKSPGFIALASEYDMDVYTGCVRNNFQISSTRHKVLLKNAPSTVVSLDPS